MKSTASIAGHPLHPMLIVVPAGGFLLTLILDLVHLVTGNDLWWQATLPVLLVSVVGALVAAIPGLVDLVTVVPKGRATLTGITHLMLNLLVVGVFAIDTWVRWRHGIAVPIVGTPGFGWTVLGVGILAVSGWLGWRMVQTFHVGVLEPAEGGLPPEEVLPARAGPAVLPEEITAH